MQRHKLVGGLGFSPAQIKQTIYTDILALLKRYVPDLPPKTKKEFLSKCNQKKRCFNTAWDFVVDVFKTAPNKTAFIAATGSVFSNKSYYQGKKDIFIETAADIEHLTDEFLLYFISDKFADHWNDGELRTHFPRNLRPYEDKRSKVEEEFFDYFSDHPVTTTDVTESRYTPNFEQLLSVATTDTVWEGMVDNLKHEKRLLGRLILFYHPDKDNPECRGKESQCRYRMNYALFVKRGSKDTDRPVRPTQEASETGSPHDGMHGGLRARRPATATRRASSKPKPSPKPKPKPKPKPSPKPKPRAKATPASTPVRVAGGTGPRVRRASGAK